MRVLLYFNHILIQNSVTHIQGLETRPLIDLGLRILGKQLAILSIVLRNEVISILVCALLHI